MSGGGVKSEWTDDMNADLERMLKDGRTYLEISTYISMHHYHVSRSAVAGRVRRYKAARGEIGTPEYYAQAQAKRDAANARRALAERARRDRLMKRELREAQKAAKKIERERETNRVRLSDGRLTPAQIIEFERRADAKGVMELGAWECRAPVGADGGADQKFCARKVVPGISYCIDCGPVMYKSWPKALTDAVKARARLKKEWKEAA